MAEILLASDATRLLFSGLAPLSRRLPGGLLHVNIIGCTLFAAVCGSSAATAATVGKITVPELKARGYSSRWSVGSLAGAGTLGLIIPPSIILIIYGVLTNTSIIRLFLAGVVPGLLLAVAFSAVLAVFARREPSGVAEAGSEAAEGLWRPLLRTLPIVILALTVIVSLYGGYASPTEAALVGTLGAVLVALLLTRRVTPVIEGFFNAVRPISMLGLILVGAKVLTAAFAYLGISREVAAFVSDSGFSRTEFLLLILVLFIALGCVMDGLSLLVMTLPLLTPALAALAIDPVWFGIFAVILIEIGQITPPVGMNLFVIRGMSGESISAIALGALPFLLTLLALVAAIMLFPQIVLYLPSAAG
jgi:C4-dicarboxylate transporter DctM subunit